MRTLRRAADWLSMLRKLLAARDQPRELSGGERTPEALSTGRRGLPFAGADPASPRAFAAFAEENLAKVVLGISWLLAASILLLWPTDRLLFPHSPELVRTFAAWRPRVAGLVLVEALLLQFVAPLRRHVYPSLLAVAGLGMEMSARILLVRHGLDTPLPYISFSFQFMLVPMLLPPGRRIAAALWLDACFLFGLLRAQPEAVHHPYFPFFLMLGGLAAFANVVFGHLVYHLARVNFLQRRALARQATALALANEKSERLLCSILPAAIAERLKEGPQAIADRFGEVTVLFADICGFTPLSESMSPEGLVVLLNEIFTAFDALVEKHGLEKIKTIGDAYMAAGGLPLPRADHAAAVADLALEMAATAAHLRTPGGRRVQMRIGMHSGPVVAGVIGRKKFSYDLWGDTVNTASRMESHGLPGTVTVSEETRRRLGAAFLFEDRGRMPVKGKGEMQLFLLLGRAAGGAQLPRANDSA